MLKKEKILFNNQDKKIKISLFSNFQNYGVDQEIENFIKEEKETSINPVSNEEVTRFRFNKELTTEHGTLFNMKFFSAGYGIEYLRAGFTEEEILNYSLNFRNSFFILDFFDDNKKNTRKKITTNYYTKLWKFNKPADEQDYIEIEKTNQIKFVNIPNRVLEKNGDEIIDFYLRVLFYNGKTGNLIPFYNTNPTNEDDEGPLFFKTKFDPINRIWWIENDSLEGEQMITQIDYINKLNDSNVNATDLRINYPPKEVFDYKTGSYKNQEDTE